MANLSSGEEMRFDDDFGMPCVLQSGCVDGYGKGRTHWHDGTLQYEGEFLNKKKHGLGKSFDRNGALVYEGQFQEGKRCGQGVLCGDGYRYEGTFQNGEENGHGILYFQDHVCYHGEFFNGQMHGCGRQYRMDAPFDLEYDGMFEHKERCGLGKLYEQGKVVYEGMFAGGQKNGHGDGMYGHRRYVGQWENGQPHGLGKEMEKDGEDKWVVFYEGEYFQGRWHGTGTCFDTLFAGSVSYCGGWKQGDPEGIGKGVFEDDDGARHFFDGTWEAGKPHGWGKVEYEDGVVVVGKFVQGVCREEHCKKRKREEPASKCGMCLGPLEGVSFAYVPCGHRCLCESCGSTLTGPWVAKCILCKAECTQLLRVY